MPACSRLLDAATDRVVRARLLAALLSWIRDWLAALPLSDRVWLKNGQWNDSNSGRFRLEAAVVCPHVCVCGATVTVDGHHGLSCRCGSGRHFRHNQLNDLLCRAFTNTGTLATREPHSLCTSGGKQPDGVTQVLWKRGRCIAWDATCPKPWYIRTVVHARAFIRSNLILKCFVSRDVSTLMRAFTVYVRPILKCASCVWSPYQISM